MRFTGLKLSKTWQGVHKLWQSKSDTSLTVVFQFSVAAALYPSVRVVVTNRFWWLCAVTLHLKKTCSCYSSQPGAFSKFWLESIYLLCCYLYRASIIWFYIHSSDLRTWRRQRQSLRVVYERAPLLRPDSYQFEAGCLRHQTSSEKSFLCAGGEW